MQEGAKIVHAILTRFNCRFADRDFPARTQPGWLESRFALFERYCLPTLKAQTSQDFEWAIFFDSQTPEPFVRRARDLFKDHPHFHIRFLEVYTGQHMEADVQDLLGGRCDWLVSTRLDNDDGLNAAFVETLRREMAVGKREAINFPKGIVLSGARTYLSRQSSNAFISVSEPFEGFGTALCAPHKDMSRVMPVRDIEADPMWLQVIHESNVSNKRRGRRVLRRDLPHGFESVTDLQQPDPTESAAAALAENLTLSVAWSARDTAVHVLRRLRGMVRAG